MKCPECDSVGQRSKVYSRGSIRTAMAGGNPFWDEDGVKHRHDPNKTTAVFACSNGHSWSIRRKRPCSADGCDFGRELD